MGKDTWVKGAWVGAARTSQWTPGQNAPNVRRRVSGGRKLTSERHGVAQLERQDGEPQGGSAESSIGALGCTEEDAGAGCAGAARTSGWTPGQNARTALRRVGFGVYHAANGAAWAAQLERQDGRRAKTRRRAAARLVEEKVSGGACADLAGTNRQRSCVALDGGPARADGGVGVSFSRLLLGGASVGCLLFGGGPRCPTVACAHLPTRRDATARRNMRPGPRRVARRRPCPPPPSRTLSGEYRGADGVVHGRRR
jgi:hypothetical protein